MDFFDDSIQKLKGFAVVCQKHKGVTEVEDMLPLKAQLFLMMAI